MRWWYVIPVLFFTFPAASQLLQGRIVDLASGNALEYATIKVKGKNLGAVSYADGHFSLEIQGLSGTDTLRVSYIGYGDVLLAIGTLDVSKSNIIKMRPVAKILKEVRVSAAVQTIKLGSTKSGGTYTGWGDFKSLRGRTIGALMDGAECPVKAKSFSFRINHNDWDSVRFRLIFYDVKGGQPDSSILQQNIFVTTSLKHKWVTVELKQHNLILCGQVIATLEWVDAWGSTGEHSNMLTLSNAKNGGFTFRQDPGEERARYSPERYIPAMHIEVYAGP